MQMNNFIEKYLANSGGNEFRVQKMESKRMRNVKRVLGAIQQLISLPICTDDGSVP